MNRYLAVLGLVLAVVLGLAALSTNDAGAAEEETIPAYFEAPDLEPTETAQIDGENIGETTALTIGSLAKLACSSIEYNGEAGSGGPVSELPVTVSPTYEECHAITPLGTKTATVTMNGCDFEIEPLATITESEEQHLLGTTDIACPEEKAIEVHIYNTTSKSDSGASTLCTFKVPAQEDLAGVTLTNKAGSPDDLVADFEMASIHVTRTSGIFCGAEEQTATYEGEATLRATTEGEEFVAVRLETPKHIRFGVDDPTVEGKSGTATIKTELQDLKCTDVEYKGTPKTTEKKVSELTLTPTYPKGKCTFDGLEAHVDFKGCQYKFTPLPNFDAAPNKTRITTATLAIVCGGGGPITVSVTDNQSQVTCTLTFAEQSTTTGHVGLENTPSLEAEDFSKNLVHFKHTVTGLEYEVKGDPSTCGKNGEKLKGGSLTGDITVQAYEKGVAKGMRIAGNFKHK